MVFAGKFDTPIRAQIQSPESQAGLACTSCHSIVHVKSSMGQGDFTIEYPPLHDLATSDNALLRAGHDYLLKLDPGPHSRTFLKSFHKQQTPQFCSACHKVHLDVPVNSYRWIRGFNEYDNWQASGVSGEGARSFYYPPKPQGCADCHMPLVPANDPAARNGQVHSHRFPAANTALPFVNQDAEQLAVTEAFLKSGAVTIDVFGLVPGAPESRAARAVGAGEPRLASTFAAGEEEAGFGASAAFVSAPAEVVAPLDKVDAALRRGDSARLEVVVRTRRVGHFFPGGTVDAFDVWVELEAIDSNGKAIFHSGLVEPAPDGGRGPVEPGAHFYRSLQLDERGNPINKRNAWATRSVAYVRLIPPGAADTVHYRLRIPEDCGDRITLRAKLNYRKFAWWNTQWAFAGVRDPEQQGYSLALGHDDGRWVFTGDTSGVSGKLKAIPDIPITVMAEAEARIRVLPKKAPAPKTEPFLEASARERWNDYGIGLLLQGDLKGAEAAFLKVTKMEPSYADGWVNVGRAQLTEGDLPAAEQSLRRALEADPELAKTHFFLGTALKQSGRYDEALGYLRRAAALYPRDRVVRNQIGRLLFLKRQYADAIAELKQVLAIDPEDLQAHYNLMLSYRGAGDNEMANEHEALYRRFKADESAQRITGPYRRAAPARQQRATSGPRARLRARADRGPARRTARGPVSGRDEVSGGPAPGCRAERGQSMSARRMVALLLALALPLAFFPGPAATQSGSGIQFADGTARAGLTFRHNSGAFGKKYLPETMGSGLALLDFDRDGWLDVFFVNGTHWPGHPGAATYPALYRNNRDGTFTDVTKAAGLAVEMFGIGVTAADYDNDGWTDIYVTAISGNHMFRNLGDGRFADVTAKTGTKGPGTFGTSAMFFDYDRDGKLDLLVANYVTWTIEHDLFCTLDGKTKSYCTPESYTGESPTLFHNRGDGTLRGRDTQGGAVGPDLEGARRRAHRPRRRRLARLRAGERHPAQQALPQRPRRHLQRGGHHGRDRLRRDRGRPRRHGGGRGRLLRQRPAEPADRATSRTR